jgi:ligand-binding sensor domain-containing protein
MRRKTETMRFARPCFTLLILGVLLVSCSGRKPSVTITQITDPNHVTGIALEGDTVWCATQGGLVRWDIQTRAYTVYTTANGLSSNVLSDVVIDGKGKLWVSGDAGIVVRNGTSWKGYDTSNGLPSAAVSDLALDSEGNVWAATDRGVVSFKGGGPRLLDDRDGPGKIPTLCIFFDSGKNMWIGTRDNGIFVNIQGAWRNLTTRDGLILNTSVSITQNADNSIWSSSWGGVSRWDGLGFQSYSVRRYYGTYDTRGMIGTPDRFWYFSANGVHASMGSKWEHFTETEGLVSNNVFCGYIDRNGRVFAGTEYGMSVIENGVITNFTIPNTPFGKDFISLAVLGNGKMFSGTDKSGLNFLDSNAWVRMYGKAKETLETVRSIVCAPDSSLVFNTSGGVATLRNGKWNVQTRDDGLAGDDVRCGMYDREGRYWIGTSTGVGCLWGGSWTRYRDSHGLPSENVWACAADSSGAVWFGTAKGIVSFAGNEITDWTPQIKAGSDSLDVRSAAAAGGTLYFGTNSGKLISYDGKSWKVSGKTSSSICAIAVEPTGALWLGTDGGGLVRTGKGFSAIYTIADGLPSNRVHALAFREGRLVAACYGGLAIIEQPIVK